MISSDFTLKLETDQPPAKVFQAILNVRSWWSGYYSEEIIGSTRKVNDEFTFRAGGMHYSKQRLVELIPDNKIAWIITESKLDFLNQPEEWTGTSIIFEISQKGDKTQLSFIHKGLTPKIECYDACAPAWTQYLQNKLLPLIDAV